MNKLTNTLTTVNHGLPQIKQQQQKNMVTIVKNYNHKLTMVLVH